MSATSYSESGLTSQSFTGWRCAAILLLLVLSLAGPQTIAASTNSAAVPARRPSERGPGITYIHDDIEEVPWSIHVVKIDRKRADLQFETTVGASRQIGMSLVSDQLKKVSPDFGRAVAAVNGDFYRVENKYQGDPYGVQILHGELISAPVSTRSCFWIGADGEPRITNVFPNFTATLPGGQLIPFGLNEDRAKDAVVLYSAANGLTTGTSGGTEIVLARGTNEWLPLQIGRNYSTVVKEIRAAGDTKLDADTLVLSAGPKVSQVAGLKVGDAVTISTGTSPGMAGSLTAIGGGPALIHGAAVGKFSGLQKREPRTALGWNKDYYFLVVVDGRQRTSVGMTFAELAKYMHEKLGCEEALNLDGGGSATMWVFGHVMNSPSEGRERPAANALVVVRKDRVQNPAD
jgi:hypothetical protein